MNSVKRALSATVFLLLAEMTFSIDFIYFAAWIGNVEIIDAKIREGVGITPDASGTTALHLAVWNMHDDVVNYLLHTRDIKTWVSAQNQDLYSALHLATWNDDGGMIKRLLEAGAKISVQDRNGLTPLHWAARHGNIEAIRVLISSGADIDIRDKQGWQPIHQAEIHGQPVAMGILSQARMKRVEEIDTRRAQVGPTARMGSRENGSANSHPGEPPKNDGSQKVRVTGKAI